MHTQYLRGLFLCGFLALGINAQQTFTETTSGSDSWNISGNWAAAIPSGGDSAVITGGNQAQVQNGATPAYTGSLTLNASSILRINNTGGAVNYNAFGGSIVMNTGSQIILVNNQTANIPAINMAGDGTINSTSNTSHHRIRNFTGALSGAGQLTVLGVNNNTVHFNAASPTFSGALVAGPSSQAWRIEANTSTAFGTANVTIDNNVTLQIDAADVIGDGATLTLTGAKDFRKASKLILNANDTIGAFVIDGVDQCFGTFDSSTHPGIITGSGSLTIPPPPGDFDADGEPNATDCAPCDNTVFPGAPEICDGKDNDCNGIVDDGLVGCNNTMAASGTWGVGGSWSLGTMPTGGQSAIVHTNVTASVTTSPTFTYTGDLTLVGTAALRLQNSTAVNALGTGVKMNTGSSITIPQATGASNTNFPPIELLGDGTINGASHHKTHNFNGVISGAGGLTFTGGNNCTFKVNLANTFAGGFTIHTGNSRVDASADGALGSGDVTIGSAASLRISSGLTNTIHDSAALYVVGPRDTKVGTSKLHLDSSETVDTFFIDGIQKTAGNYNSTSGLTDFGGSPLISGTGTLTVLSNPPAVAPNLVSIVDDVFGGPIYQNHPGITYTVTFDIDMDAGTVSAADFENGGTATIAIGAVTEPAAGVFAVPVTFSSAGTVRLRIKAGAVLDSDLGVPLDTTSALPDDTTITVNAGNAPDTTITGTANGPGGSDDNWNNAANWDIGIPFGNQNVIVGAVNAQIDTAVRDFTGNITVNSGGTWQFKNANGTATVPTAPETITLNAGSKINAFTTITFQTITLAGDAEIQAGASTTGHHGSRTFAGVISGSGKLTLGGVNNNTFNINASNTHSGGLETRNVQNQRHRVNLNSNGATGAGNVTINDYASLIVGGGLGDAIANGATLSVNGLKDSSSAAKLVLNSDETVQFLNIDGVAIVPGDYTSASGLTVGGDPFISGTGTLTVTGGGTVVRIR